MNAWAKSRKIDDPYLEVVSGDWTWRVLKAYQTREKERTNQYARWFCAVKSPYTYDQWELGDTYINDIPLESEHFKILAKRSLEEKSGIPTDHLFIG